ncbi:hypothetical protein LGM48_11610 [Burkholderia multivorans]|uniref:hypothetical protein n=1 Tax=Burkholderia multivorans TaxID=87883 RepID=UPI0020B43ED4|nr:hypothetical protein [Burkholderia multivorans]MCA8174969.1 hypothetical protein [Burkholderia multivorans]
MSFDLELEGRRVLVTGGTKGVDAAVVSAFADFRRGDYQSGGLRGIERVTELLTTPPS